MTLSKTVHILDDRNNRRTAGLEWYIAAVGTDLTAEEADMVIRLVVLIAAVAVTVMAESNATEEVRLQEFEEQTTAPFLPSFIASTVSLFQGRGKKGGGQGLGMAMMMGGMMVAMGLAALAALSGKAMAASMAALMLAAMSLMKKHSGGGHSSYEVISVPGGHHHRSLAEGEGYTSYGAEGSSQSEEVADRLVTTR